mmetsp:Transcript_12459/g.28858  ORF Transcript_12459/g.28858 Transcript_12459/m.28858 type:complete len:93 (-) Transcript_12459:893-1171(-)
MVFIKSLRRNLLQIFQRLCPMATEESRWKTIVRRHTTFPCNTTTPGRIITHKSLPVFPIARASPISALRGSRTYVCLETPKWGDAVVQKMLK